MEYRLTATDIERLYQPLDDELVTLRASASVFVFGGAALVGSFGFATQRSTSTQRGNRTARFSEQS
jgi:hypothetical protein